MSFQTNDNTPVITRDNYEEYFLMYVDNELSPKERSMVEAFLQFHPELQVELDMLMGARLEPETLSFGNLESLLAENIGQAAIDENLLLHIDNELPQSEKEKLEKRLQVDENYRMQMQWLLRTKSDPAEAVPYPNKEELYRHTEHRLRYGFALRIAAAVLLLASLGVVWLTQRESGDAVPSVAASQPVEVNAGKGLPASDDQKQVHIAPAQSLEAESAQLAQAAPESKKQQFAAKKHIESLPPSNKQEQQVVPFNQPEKLLAYEPAHQPEKASNSVVAEPAAPAKKDFELPVTSVAAQPYNPTETVAEPTFASAPEEGRSGKNNLKSLLRKATRMVERRAHIEATNGDEELIIGAVAIKLK